MAFGFASAQKGFAARNDKTCHETYNASIYFSSLLWPAAESVQPMWRDLCSGRKEGAAATQKECVFGTAPCGMFKMRWQHGDPGLFSRVQNAQRQSPSMLLRKRLSGSEFKNQYYEKTTCRHYSTLIKCQLNIKNSDFNSVVRENSIRPLSLLKQYT